LKKKILHIIREENFLSLAGNLVIALFGIAGFGLLARTLPVNEFGQWMLFITGGSFIEMFRFGITNTGLIRFLSGADNKERIHLIGSNAVIGVISTAGVSVLLLLCNIIFHSAIQQSGYALFFNWYPLLAFINLPWNNALVVLQADRRFGSILLLKSVNSIGFFMVVLYNYFTAAFTLTQLVWILLLINVVTSAISFYKGWDGLRLIKKAAAHTNRQLLHFGKYTTFTLIGTNLLRSADTIIISLSPLGSEAVALYSIPLKLTELQQIPLRSFTATAFPKMSKASLNGKLAEVKQYFYTYAGAITCLFVFVSGFTFLFAEFFVLLLAGENYLHTEAVTIVRIFSVYGLILPLDRMTGIGLDSINKPQVNALKVFYMVTANIIGDILAVFVFKSLIMVAVGSIVFTLVGIFTGMYFLNKELTLRYKDIFIQGLAFYKTYYTKFFHAKSGGSLKTVSSK
jgi:O-antigen/teichoic acid export membrane protein